MTLRTSWRASCTEIPPITGGSSLSLQNRAALWSGNMCWGQLLSFGIGGNAAPHLEAGWGSAEPAFCWTQAEMADLTFKFAKPPGDLVLSFTVQPHLCPEVEFQEATALWDNTPVGSWSIRKPGTYHALVLAQVMSNLPTHRLSFRLPGSFSPLSRGLSADPRRLGLAFIELVLQPAQDLGLQ